MKQNKYNYLLVIQSMGDGIFWDDESEYNKLDYSEKIQAYKDLKEYRLAYSGMNTPIRIITRRVLNTLI